MRQDPRELAVRLLLEVEEKGAFAESLLERTLDRSALEKPDRRLLTQLVYGTLRWRGLLDWWIDGLCRMPGRPLQPPVRNILRTALFQLRYLDRIPPFAAVNEAVRIAKVLAPGRAGFVNALLRSALRLGPGLPLPPPNPLADLAGHLGVVHSHPPWLVARWLAFLGQEETEALCRADNAIPPRTIRVNRLRTSRDLLKASLEQEGLRAEHTPYSPDGLILSGAEGPLREHALFGAGHFQIQDEASQLVARAAAPAPGQAILDVCAGSGGKSTHLAELRDDQGPILATDIQAGKITALAALAQRLGISSIHPRQADALAEPDPSLLARFDLVFADVPCSGLGTLRRNPEIRWRCRPGDPARHALRQRRILAHAAACVRPEGLLVYCTCSLLPEENEEVVRDFLAGHGEFLLSPPPAPPPPGFLDEEGCFRSYPHRHGTDGLFAAFLRRARPERRKTLPAGRQRRQTILAGNAGACSGRPVPGEGRGIGGGGIVRAAFHRGAPRDTTRRNPD